MRKAIRIGWRVVLAIGISLLALLLAWRLGLIGPPEGKAPPGTVHSHYKVAALDIQVSLYSRGDPDGQRVILVHGTPGDALGWERYLAMNRKGVRFVAIDRPGFGDTRPPGAVTVLARQAQAIAPLLVKHHGRWPILVGHSLGGPIVAQLAADNPGKVESLLILAGSFDPGQENIYMMQNVAEWPGLRALVPVMLRNTNLELLALKPQLEALAPRLGAIRCRVTIVQGTKDSNVPFANLPFLQSRLTRAERIKPIVLQGRNHFIPWEEFPVVESALDDLLRSGSRPC